MLKLVKCGLSGIFVYLAVDQHGKMSIFQSTREVVWFVIYIMRRAYLKPVHFVWKSKFFPHFDNVKEEGWGGGEVGPEPKNFFKNL